MRNLAIIIGMTAALSACATNEPRETFTVTMNSIDNNGIGASIGTVSLADTSSGLLITPNLRGLTPGDHGFHIHEKPNCAPADKDGAMVAGLAAGGHYDPSGSKAHAGPQGSGHLGDLPALKVAADGRAAQAVTAPRLKLADVRGRSLMVHAGGDNYADQPQPLGGGGGRVACGIIR